MCENIAATVQADGKVLDEALDQLAAAVEPTNATLAATLTTVGAGIESATANFQTGSATAIIDDAEGAALTALELIPLTAPYANFAAIAFAGLNLLIANSKTQPAQAAATTGVAKMMIVAHAASVNTSGSKWFGKAKIDYHHGGVRKGFENAWNGEAEEHPDLGFKPITF